MEIITSKISPTSAKILVWLWALQQTNSRAGSLEDFDWLVPTLTLSGRRSLVAQLKQKKYLSVDVVDQDKQLYLTTHGAAALTAHFPALSNRLGNWQGEWAMLVFQRSPKSDPQFRYLRQLLVEAHAGQLSRGVYLYPIEFPDKIKQQLAFYIDNVLVLTVSSWQMGDERSVIVPLFQLSDLIESLSGVSREVDSLLSGKIDKKRTIVQQREVFSAVYDRLLFTLQFDLGLHKRYFSQVPDAKDVLLKLVRAV